MTTLILVYIYIYIQTYSIRLLYDSMLGMYRNTNVYIYIQTYSICLLYDSMLGMYRNQPLINWINDNPDVVPRFEVLRLLLLMCSQLDQR
jgi:hypothetical protein